MYPREKEEAREEHPGCCNERKRTKERSQAEKYTSAALREAKKYKKEASLAFAMVKKLDRVGKPYM